MNFGVVTEDELYASKDYSAIVEERDTSELFDQIHYMDLFYGIILANVLMQIFYRNQELFFYANIRKASSKQELKIFCLLIIKKNFSIQYLQFIFS